MAFPSSPTNGQLAVQNGITYTYNSTYSSWTRNPSTLPALSIIVDTFTGNGSTVAFTLSVIPSNADFISINIAGVSQLKSAYTLSSNIVTFTSAPSNGAVIEVKSWNSAAVGVLTGLTFNSFTGNGSTVAYTLSTTPTNKNYTLVTIGGITQEKVNYNVSGTTLTFTTAPPNTAPIEVTTFGPAINTAVTADTLRITTVAYPGSVTAANPAGGETITVTGSGFNVGIIAYINNTTACATTYISSTSLTFIAPATSAGTYNIVLYNTDGSSGVKPIGIIFSSLPSWVTASGALTGGSQNAVYSSSVSATGDGTITYAVTTGSLPTGLNLNSSTGAITGTPTVIVTSTFSITATDSQNQIVARSFSIAIANVVSAVEYLVVAGGGGGGTQSGGGGGAGGYRTDTGFAVASGTPITVTVGGGGAGTATGANGDRPAGTTGTSSVFSTITSLGGGGGGCYRGGVGLAGNSGSSGGGGGVGGSAGAAGGSGTAGPPRQGYDGGIGGVDNSSNQDVGGGGGGAGAVGVSYNDANTAIRGDGGAGSTSSISGTSVTYAGGGGGATYGGPRAGAGGSGGGGAGGNSTGSVTASNGNPNTGGGGGGGWEFNNAGGTGGSGVVIIRYADTYNAATSTTGSPTITTAGGYRVYKWTSSGTITF